MDYLIIWRKWENDHIVWQQACKPGEPRRPDLEDVTRGLAASLPTERWVKILFDRRGVFDTNIEMQLPWCFGRN